MMMRTGAGRLQPVDLAGTGLVGLLGIGAYFAFPDDLALLTRMLSLAFLVLSLDLVTGYGGVLTLGHAAPFGAGAYAAGMACVAGLSEPLVLLLVGMLAGMVTGVGTGALILRASGLAQLVMSIATVLMLREIANRARAWTGGSDGLSGIEPGPVLGLFRFDLQGRTGYLLALALLMAILPLLRLIMASPFGLTCRGVARDPVRMRALGIEPLPVLLRLYALSGAVAGVGGALSAVTAQVVALDALGFERSASALVMLVLGGPGTLYGALAGTALFVVLEHILAAWSPFHWLALLGAMLIAITLVLPGGLRSAGALLARFRAVGDRP